MGVGVDPCARAVARADDPEEMATVADGRTNEPLVKVALAAMMAALAEAEGIMSGVSL